MRSLFFSWRVPPVALMALLFALALAAPARAEVPHKAAVPAYAEEQTVLQAEIDSVTPEPGRLSGASGRVHIDRHFLGQYGAAEQNVILQRGGNTWRVLRNGPLAMVSGTLLLVVPLLLVGFYAIAGPARAHRPQTGRRIERFTAWERWVHWATAISFLVMAFTGLVIMFGKKVLLPILGHDVFSWVAAISKYLHNFIGPLFIVCSVIMFVTFVRKNFFRRWDWQWIRQGGGLLSHKHIPADFFNAGEKLWFWGGVTLLGLLMSVTGLILDFVNFGQTRYVLQIANSLHIVGSSLYIAAAMGHIYIGTLGTPGAYEAMRHGTVDEEWAREHHEIWYQTGVGAPPDRPRPGPAAPGSTPGPVR